MSRLRVVPPDEPPPPEPPYRPRLNARRGVFLVLLTAAVLIAGGILMWWLSTADVREIQALPDDQRLPLYQRTMENLTNVCDPAAPRSLRAFCHDQAALALKFRECHADPRCQEVARRHLPTTRR